MFVLEIYQTRRPRLVRQLDDGLVLQFDGVGLVAAMPLQIKDARRKVQMLLQNPFGSLNPRCPHASARCRAELPALLILGGRRVACHGVEEGRI